ncbi:MAG: hypothetical protein NT062_35430 [Proteobacteria bacterium]|nr:hypothetical protein [Pseudomonadota bacterium]
MSELPTHWSDRLGRIDRRWIFLVMGLAIVLPLYLPLGLPIKASPMTKAAFDTVENLHEGDVVFVSMDLDPASTAELEPYYRAVILQLKRKHVRLAFATLWYQAPPLVERWLRETVDEPLAPAGTEGYAGLPDRAYVRNVDYINLGFREGRENVMLGMGADLARTFDGKTEDGVPLEQIPWMANIHGLADFKLMVLVSAGAPGAKEYVQYVQNRYALKMVAVTTSVSVTDLAPYFQAGQLLGLVPGLSGSAEYEILVGKPALGVAGANVLNAGHGVVILAILLGNAAYFAGKRRKKRMKP